MLEPAFHARYGVDLEDVLHVKTWRWFTVRAGYLLCEDNPLTRTIFPSRFQPPEIPEPPPLEL